MQPIHPSTRFPRSPPLPVGREAAPALAVGSPSRAIGSAAPRAATDRRSPIPTALNRPTSARPFICDDDRSDHLPCRREITTGKICGSAGRCSESAGSLGERGKDRLDLQHPQRRSGTAVDTEPETEVADRVPGHVEPLGVLPLCARRGWLPLTSPSPGTRVSVEPGSAHPTPPMSPRSGRRPCSRCTRSAPG